MFVILVKFNSISTEDFNKKKITYTVIKIQLKFFNVISSEIIFTL